MKTTMRYHELELVPPQAFNTKKKKHRWIHEYVFTTFLDCGREHFLLTRTGMKVYLGNKTDKKLAGSIKILVWNNNPVVI